MGTTQSASAIHTCEESETFIRAVGNVSINKGTNAGNFALALVVVRDGFTPLTMSITNNVELYEADRDILWSFAGQTASGMTPTTVPLDTKGMRKLQKGDTLYFIGLGNSSDIADYVGVLNMFFKQ